jgi:hypothetical protein
MNRIIKPTLFRTILQAEQTAEDGVIRLATQRLLHFRQRHPLLYGLIAFVLGGALVSLFVLSPYVAWLFDGYAVDYVTALRRLIVGGLGGGLAALVLAFLYARSLRPLQGQNWAAPGQ